MGSTEDNDAVGSNAEALSAARHPGRRPKPPADDPAPSGPFCGGIAGIQCPGAGRCTDNPNDGCDPQRGGADCGGLCVCDALAKCAAGNVFDSSPDVCSCVPDPAADPCAAVRCAAGTHCEAPDGKAVCTPDVPTGPFCGGFAGFACPGFGECVDNPNDGCDPNNGGADCGGNCACVERVFCVQGKVFDSSPDVCACVDPAPNPCAAVLCQQGSQCQVQGGKGVCVPNEPSGPFCGGIASIACPGGGICSDNPNDGCDPARGGADCGGTCTCIERVLCIQGKVFDSSPEVCACVDAAPDACAAVRCRAGFTCEVNGGKAQCVPADACQE